MKKTYSFLALLLAIILAASSLCSCTRIDVNKYTTSQTSSINTDVDDPTGKTVISADTFKFVQYITEMWSVYPCEKVEVQDEENYIDSIKEFLTSTGDKYAYFYTDEEMEALLLDRSGELCGIGITSIFDYNAENIEIYAVYEDAPANEYLEPGDFIVGVKIGDEIVRFETLVDKHLQEVEKLEESKDYTEKEIRHAALYYAFEEVIENIRGEEGTYATLIYKRNGVETEVTIKRAKITAHSVNYSLLPSDNTTGLIRISQFDMTTYPQFREAMDDLIGKGMTKVIFDMRGNPGGSVEALNSMLSMLTPYGTLLYSTKDSIEKEEQVYSKEYIYSETSQFYNQTLQKEDVGKYSGMAISILIDEDSASAAEIFSGVLRDAAGAKLVGHKSFGKGIIQTTYPLKSLYDAYKSYFFNEGINGNISGYLKITTEYDVLPVSGSFHTQGLEPDYTVDLTEEQELINVFKRTEDTDDQLKKAVEVVNELYNK